MTLFALSLLALDTAAYSPAALRKPPIRIDAPRLMLWRCAAPVALEPAFGPHLDSAAAAACLFSLSPVVLAYHWGSEWNQARDQLAKASEALRRERARLLCGEGCVLDYEEAEVAVLHAQQVVKDFRNFRVAGATRELYSQMGIAQRRVVASRRAPQVVMCKTRGP